METEPNPAQDEALKQAHAILEPFFDSFVIVGRFSKQDGKIDSVRWIKQGAHTDCRGLVETYRDYLVQDNARTAV